MSLLEDLSASFIVRIWCERGDGPVRTQEWRGSIEHVQSGRRSFFRELGAITQFMQSDLRKLGIDGPMRFWEAMSTELADPAAVPQVPPEPPRPAAPGSRRSAARKR